MLSWILIAIGAACIFMGGREYYIRDGIKLAERMIAAAPSSPQLASAAVAAIRLSPLEHQLAAWREMYLIHDDCPEKRGSQPCVMAMYEKHEGLIPGDTSGKTVILEYVRLRNIGWELAADIFVDLDGLVTIPVSQKLAVGEDCEVQIPSFSAIIHQHYRRASATVPLHVRFEDRGGNALVTKHAAHISISDSRIEPIPFGASYHFEKLSTRFFGSRVRLGLS